jgi:U3 small nucleolar RNA-associated protein 23
MADLRALGGEFAAARRAAKAFALHKCGHEEALASATDCLAAQVAAGNPEHFLVATQDRDLQRRVLAERGGAVIFASANGPQLAAPPAAAARSPAAARGVAAAAEAGGRVLAELAEAELAERPREKSLFRRKRAKGANPLSAKKKVVKARAAAAAAPAAGAADGEERRKRQRRKRDAPSGAD